MTMACCNLWLDKLLTDKSAQLPPAVFIMGPTASGKTGLALELAAELPCELISVDSALIYRGMDIGTAKPEREILQQYPHHLIDIREPSESYSAASFRLDALAHMQAATAAGRLPVLVGGTMLYYKALLEGMSQMPAADAKIRAELELECQQEGLAALHEMLAKVDPQAAQRIHPNDSQRILRALEVWRSSGVSMSELQQQASKQALPYRVLALALAPEQRSVLHQRIADRFEQMLAQGLLDEVAGLLRRQDLHADLPSMRSVGYRQVWEYLQGDYDYQQMQQRAVAATRQLAKRQLTWLRSWPDLHWLDSLANNNLAQSLKIMQQHSILD